MFEMQVYVNVGLTEKDWVSVTPSGSNKPYRYKTEQEAKEMLDMCYPYEYNVRVKKVV